MRLAIKVDVSRLEMRVSLIVRVLALAHLVIIIQLHRRAVIGLSPLEVWCFKAADEELLADLGRLQVLRHFSAYNFGLVSGYEISWCLCLLLRNRELPKPRQRLAFLVFAHRAMSQSICIRLVIW